MIFLRHILVVLTNIISVNNGLKRYLSFFIVVFILSNLPDVHAESGPAEKGSHESENVQTAIRYLHKTRDFMDTNSDSANFYGNKSYYLSLAANRKDIAGKAIEHLGYVTYYSGDYDNSQLFFEKAIELYTVVDSMEYIAKCYEWLGNISLRTTHYGQSMQYYIRSMELYDSLGIEKEKIKAYLNFGKVYMQELDFEKAFENFKLVQKLYSDTEPDIISTIRILNNLGISAQHTNRLEEAEEYFNEAMHLAEASQSPRAIIVVHSNLAALNIEKKLYDKAIDQLMLKIELCNKIDNKFGLGGAYTNLGNLYFLLADYTVALEYFEKSINIAQELNNLFEVKYVSGMISNIYDSIDNSYQASFYKNLQNKIADSISLIQQTEQFDQLKTRMEFVRMETELELIVKEKRIEELTNYWMLALLAGIVLCLIVWLYFLYHKRKREKLILIKENDLIAAKLGQSKLKEEKLKQELNYKIRQLSTHALNIMQKNEALRQLKEKVVNIEVSPKNTEKFSQIADIVNNNLSTNKDWENFNSYFEQINPDFFVKLKNISADFSDNELRFCSLIKQKYNSREISSILNLSPNTIKSTKYRIRKKLPIQSDQRLDDYIQTL